MTKTFQTETLFGLRPVGHRAYAPEGFLYFSYCDLFDICYLEFNLLHLRYVHPYWVKSKPGPLIHDSLLVFGDGKGVLKSSLNHDFFIFFGLLQS